MPRYTRDGRSNRTPTEKLLVARCWPVPEIEQQLPCLNDCGDATQWSEAWRYAKRGSGWKPAAASVIIFRICGMHLPGSSRTCSPSPGSQAQLSCCSPFRHASTKSSRLYGKIAIQQKKSRESTIRRENVLPAFLPRNATWLRSFEECCTKSSRLKISALHRLPTSFDRLPNPPPPIRTFFASASSGGT